MLEEYFRPHNLLNLIQFALVIFSFDVIGWRIVQLLQLKIPDTFRLTVWMIGLGITTLALFVWHLRFPITGFTYYLVTLVPAFLTLRVYLKSHARNQLAIFFRRHLLFILLLTPLIPYFYIKTSLPPYVWDEMAYHYYSPYKLNTELVWQFSGLYQNIPRLMDTAFIGVFAFTKTYATARLLHLLVFLSTLLVVYKSVHKYIGMIAAVLITALLTYLSPQLILETTYGYTDVAAACFIVLAILAAGRLMQDRDWGLLPIFAAFSGLAVGTKYSVLSPFLVSTLVILAYAYRQRKKIQWHSFSRYLIISAGFFLLMGGYWYLKNWWVTGNPIYPFLFGCKDDSCNQDQNFFWWAVPFTTSNIPKILSTVTVGPSALLPLLASITAVGLLLASSITRKAMVYLLAILSLDWFLASRTSGFEARYFFHWRFIALTIVALSAHSIILQPIKRLNLKFLLVFLSIGVLVILSAAAIKLRTVYQNYLPGGAYHLEAKFAFGRANIVDWLSTVLPQTNQVVTWCDSQSDNPTLAIMDPDLLWYSPEAQFHIFLTRCRHGGSIRKDRPTYLVSLDDCQQRGKIPPRFWIETEEQYQMRLENHEIVCGSSMIVKNLYKYTP